MFLASGCTMFAMANSELLAVIEAFTRQSTAGVEMDPSLSLSDVMAFANLPRENALRALRALAKENSITIRSPSPNPGGEAEIENMMYLARLQIFVKYDKATVGNDPHADARLIEQKIPNTRGTSLSVEEFIRENSWPVRRVNPAIVILLSSGRFEGAQAFKGDGLLRSGLWYRGNF